MDIGKACKRRTNDEKPLRLADFAIFAEICVLRNSIILCIMQLKERAGESELTPPGRILANG